MTRHWFIKLRKLLPYASSWCHLMCHILATESYLVLFASTAFNIQVFYEEGGWLPQLFSAAAISWHYLTQLEWTHMVWLAYWDLWRCTAWSPKPLQFFELAVANLSFFTSQAALPLPIFALEASSSGCFSKLSTASLLEETCPEVAILVGQPSSLKNLKETVLQESRSQQKRRDQPWHKATRHDKTQTH